MYSAKGLDDGLFSEEDLPDSLFLQPFDLSAVDQSYAGEEIFRNGTVYGPSEHISNQTVEFGLDSLGNPSWLMVTDGTVIFEIPCLFDEASFDLSYPEDNSPKDLFKDTYIVKAYDAQGALIITDTYVRESLCVWVGGEPESSLVFIDEPSEGFVYGWVAEIIEFDGFKEGTQNTPVGEYPVPTGQFEGGKLVVSEEE